MPMRHFDSVLPGSQPMTSLCKWYVNFKRRAALSWPDQTRWVRFSKRLLILEPATNVVYLIYRYCVYEYEIKRWRNTCTLRNLILTIRWGHCGGMRNYFHGISDLSITVRSGTITLIPTGDFVQQRAAFHQRCFFASQKFQICFSLYHSQHQLLWFCKYEKNDIKWVDTRPFTGTINKG